MSELLDTGVPNCCDCYYDDDN